MDLPFFDSLENALGTAKSKGGLRLKPRPIFIAGIVLLAMAYLFMPTQVTLALSLALFLAPVWLPLLLIGGAWGLWVILRRSLYIASLQTVLLEIKPPRGLDKTPLAMEAVLSGIHLSPGEGTWYHKYILGRVRPWWSLEIASLEGQVHFFIWTRANYRKIVESQIYAQYPGAQVVEVPDYTRILTASPEEWNVWGCDFVHTTKNPVPLKTYVEYGLDKVQKEPEQVDPLANMIEFMGSLGKGEYMWLQYIVRVHKGEIYHGELNSKGEAMTWKDEAKEIIDEIRKSTRDPYIDASGKEVQGFPNPTKGQSELIAAVERNVSKLGFDVGARGVYIADKEHFDAINITGLAGVFKQFSAEKPWNGVKPTGWMTEFNDFPWEIGVNKLKNIYRAELINAYRRRQFFYEPFAMHEYMIMSTEELATIFHIPSRAIDTPTLQRIQSATSEAPSNLPT